MSIVENFESDVIECWNTFFTIDKQNQKEFKIFKLESHV